MKKIIIIILCVILCILLTGCTQVSKPEDSTTYAMIIMPDGSIIKGKCEDYMRYTHNWMQIQINGITYYLNDWRVILYK